MSHYCWCETFIYFEAKSEKNRCPVGVKSKPHIATPLSPHALWKRGSETRTVPISQLELRLIEKQRPMDLMFLLLLLLMLQLLQWHETSRTATTSSISYIFNCLELRSAQLKWTDVSLGPRIGTGIGLGSCLCPCSALRTFPAIATTPAAVTVAAAAGILRQFQIQIAVFLWLQMPFCHFLFFLCNTLPFGSRL